MQFIHNLYIIDPYIRNIAPSEYYEKLSAISCQSLKDKITDTCQISYHFNNQEGLQNKTFYFCTKRACSNFSLSLKEDYSANRIIR